MQASASSNSKRGRVIVRLVKPEPRKFSQRDFKALGGFGWANLAALVRCLRQREKPLGERPFRLDPRTCLTHGPAVAERQKACTSQAGAGRAQSQTFLQPSPSMPMNRRDWLRLAAAAIPGLASFKTRFQPSPPFSAGLDVAGGGTTPRTTHHAPLTVPNRLGKIGVQLYTVRDALAKAFEGTLARVAAIGYQQVEFAGYFNRSPRHVPSAVAAVGLEAPSAHIGMPDVRERWQETLAAAYVVGHRYLVVASLDHDKTLDDYKAAAEALNHAGEAAHAAGIQLAYHNHDAEFAPLEGQVPYDVLLERTDPKLVQLELDLYGITHGGGDPLAYFKRDPGRFPLIHAKDMDRQRQMVPVGRGGIDWVTIFRRQREAGIHYVFVEHDNPTDPFESIRESYAYLSHLEF